MKRILFFVVALYVCGISTAQIAPTYAFRKPTAVNATTWKFSSVISGVDAIISVIGSKNATLDRIDDSAVYAYAWQPFIKYTSTMNSMSDSSYLVFNVSFVKSGTGTASAQSNVAMTVIDCDGSNAIRELIKVALPATATVISGSQLTEWKDTSLLNIISGTTNYSNIDTSIYAAMTQINFTNIASFTMRVGAIGKVSANSVRQASFYFKPFNAFVQPLPVTLTNFDVKLTNQNADLNWSTVSEENMKSYEVCRSTDGINYMSIGSVNASTNSNELINYSFTDFNAADMKSAVIYYRLKMIDNQNYFKYSNITQIRSNWSSDFETVTVFPNPTTDFVQVELPSDSEIKVTLVDMNGKVVETSDNSDSSNNMIQFDVRNLVNGVYFINIMNNDGTSSSRKFIKR
jgi:hypothetical protein